MISFSRCRVLLQNGGSLVIEQTEALVSIDVNGGHSMFGRGTSQEKAILEVNLEAAKQVCDIFELSWEVACFVCSQFVFSRTLVSYQS